MKESERIIKLIGETSYKSVALNVAINSIARVMQDVAMECSLENSTKWMDVLKDLMEEDEKLREETKD